MWRGVDRRRTGPAHEQKQAADVVRKEIVETEGREVGVAADYPMGVKIQPRVTEMR